MKILVAHDGGSGCAFYRVLLPLKELAKHGDYDVTFRAVSPPNLTGDEYITHEDAAAADIIVGQRLNTYDGLKFWRRWATSPAKKMIYENDDDVFHVTHDNFQAYEIHQDPEVRAALRGYMRFSDLLTVTNEHLGRVLCEESGTSAPYAALPNCIPEYVLGFPRDDKPRPRLGWIGGSSHSRDIALATPSVRRFMERFPDWDLFICGQDMREAFKVPDDRSFHVPWLPITTETRLYYRSVDYDIGICPLLDTKFARSKSPIKALEYSARGTPVIASDVLPYRNFIRHGETGFLVKRDHEWLKYLSLLASDEDLRLKMGAAAKEEARKHTIENNWQLWAEAYGSLLK